MAEAKQGRRADQRLLQMQLQLQLQLQIQLPSQRWSPAVPSQLTDAQAQSHHWQPSQWLQLRQQDRLDSPDEPIRQPMAQRQRPLQQRSLPLLAAGGRSPQQLQSVVSP